MRNKQKNIIKLNNDKKRKIGFWKNKIQIGKDFNDNNKEINSLFYGKITDE